MKLFFENKGNWFFNPSKNYPYFFINIKILYDAVLLNLYS